MKITHLVLSGGGMRGVMFIGAIRYLYFENLHKNITHIAGTSIGSIIGLAIALKLNIQDMEEIILKGNQDYKLCNIPYKNCIKLITECGLSDVNLFSNYLKDFIYTKYPDITDEITFSYLSKRFGVNLYVSVTNIYTCKNKIFSLDTTPDVCVFKACSASMTLPILFKPVKIDDDYYYDGGFTNNFPIKIFENVPMDNILGMILYKAFYDKEIPDKEIARPKLNFMFLLRQFIQLYEKIRTRVSLGEFIDNDKIDYYYIPNNIPDVPMMNIELEKKGLRIKLPIDSYNNMLYAGFESMSKYIIDRKNKLLEKDNNRYELNM
tara:strand:+ start:6979 stop:7941 length:963 start_codon:yes stop_codon:yes gene_type:complete